MVIFDTPVDRKHTQSIRWSELPSEDAIPLCIADMDFLVPPAIAAALEQRVLHGVFGYTQYSESFYATIAAWVKRRHRWAISESWIAMNQGVVASLCTAIRAFTQEGDRVIIQPPVYQPFFSVIRNNRRTLVENPLRLVHGRYQMDFDLLEEQARDARLLILCNPHNPVGRVWSAEELTRLGRICLEHGVIVVSDDIHADFAQTQLYRPFASLHADFAQQSIVCLSPSKTFNIAGLNCSYEIIANPTLREQIQREKAGSGISRPNLFSILALEYAYRECDEWLDALLQYLEESRAMITAQVHSMDAVELIEAEGTYLAWLDCRQRGRSSDALTDYLLQEAHIRLVSGRVFGAAGEGFLRMNYATRHANLQTGLERFAAALART